MHRACLKHNITLHRITSGIQYHIHNILAMHICGLGQSNWVIHSYYSYMTKQKEIWNLKCVCLLISNYENLGLHHNSLITVSVFNLLILYYLTPTNLYYLISAVIINWNLICKQHTYIIMYYLSVMLEIFLTIEHCYNPTCLNN